jgi:hypothetical protein
MSERALPTRASSYAISKALHIGLASSGPEATRLLVKLATDSAPATSTLGNRRYGVFFLTVRSDLVEDVNLPEGINDWCETCMGTGVVFVPDGTIPCQDCEG